MSLETTFLRIRFGRRIFLLFVFCALVPISVFAIVSLHSVTEQLQEQSHRRLEQASREEGMIIYERLTFLESDMILIGLGVRDNPAATAPRLSETSIELSPELASHFKGVALVTPEGTRRNLFGNIPPSVAFSSEEQAYLDSGKNVLSTVPCGGETCILLSRIVGPHSSPIGTLVAEINPSYLLDHDEFDSGIEIRVLDSDGRPVLRTADSENSLPSQISQSSSGEFEGKGETGEYLASYWNLPLVNSFFARHWTVIASQAKPELFAPLARFRSTFLLVCLLALWIVLLLSLIQIRRSLVPLEKLKDGTRRVSEGQFKTRVTLQTGDEFQDLADSFNFMAGRIEKQLNSMTAINELDRAVLSAWDIEKIVDTLSRRLGELLPLDFLSVSLFDSSESLTALTHIYRSDGSREISAEIIEFTPEEKRRVSSASGVTVMVPAEGDARHLRPLTTRGMKHFLRVPIVVDGGLSAIFTLARATASDWTEEDKDHLRQLADQVAVAFSNSQLVFNLQELQWGTLTALARAIDAKSPWTLGHSERVTDWAIKIAKAMGLPAKELETIRRGGLLHDIGKIGTPVSVLDKPGRLTAEETREMQQHVVIGARILDPIPGLSDSMPIVLQHHEWVDGTGYPNGLKGDAISLHARIFAVADCFDALISDRPYRRGLPVERVMQIMQEGSGTHFDPFVLEVFQRVAAPQEKPRETEEPSGAMVTIA